MLELQIKTTEICDKLDPSDSKDITLMEKEVKEITTNIQVGLLLQCGRSVGFGPFKCLFYFFA